MVRAPVRPACEEARRAPMSRGRRATAAGRPPPAPDLERGRRGVVGEVVVGVERSRCLVRFYACLAVFHGRRAEDAATPFRTHLTSAASTRVIFTGGNRVVYHGYRCYRWGTVTVPIGSNRSQNSNLNLN
jgi:hypothetical protein